MRRCASTGSGCHQTSRLQRNAAAFNRRMRKTARPVVWEGAEAQSSAPDPIKMLSRSPYGASALPFLRGQPRVAAHHGLERSRRIHRDERTKMLVVGEGKDGRGV